MADEKCPCVIVDDANNCIDCGAPVTDGISLTYLRTQGVEPGPPLPADAPIPAMGNIVGIMQLAKSTFREGVKRQMRNSDPMNPKIPRLQMMGTMLLRVPHADIWKQLLRLSFEQAQQMGYKGTPERWEAIVEEAASER